MEYSGGEVVNDDFSEIKDSIKIFNYDLQFKKARQLIYEKIDNS